METFETGSERNLKSCGPKGPYGFDPRLLHQFSFSTVLVVVVVVVPMSHTHRIDGPMEGTQGAVAVGALLEIGVHLLDLVRFLTGEEISSVQCTITPAPNAGPETGVRAELRTSGGISCALDVARVEAQRVGRTEWSGTEGTIKADWVTRTVTRAANDGTSRT